MMFPGDLVNQFASALQVSLGGLEHDALFEDHGVSWLAVDVRTRVGDLLAVLFSATASLILAEVQ